jgi:hypothetical protein
VADSCEHGNEISGPSRGRKFLHKLYDYNLLKDNSAPFFIFTFPNILPSRRVGSQWKELSSLSLSVQLVYM